MAAGLGVHGGLERSRFSSALLFSYISGLILLLTLAARPQATLLPQPLEAHVNLFSLFSAGSPSMIREQMPLLSSVASLLGMSLRCVKPCKSLHVYNWSLSVIASPFPRTPVSKS
jgi:hypothetical protein